jgi:hypothetical protein
MAGRTLVNLVPICNACHDAEHGFTPKPQVGGVAPTVIPWNGSRYLGKTGKKLKNKPRPKKKKKRKKGQSHWAVALNLRGTFKEAPTAKEQRRAKEGQR